MSCNLATNQCSLPYQKGEVKVPCAIREQIVKNDSTCTTLRTKAKLAPETNFAGLNRRVLQKNAEKYCSNAELRRKSYTSKYNALCGRVGGKRSGTKRSETKRKTRKAAHLRKRK